MQKSTRSVLLSFARYDGSGAAITPTLEDWDVQAATDRVDARQLASPPRFRTRTAQELPEQAIPQPLLAMRRYTSLLLPTLAPPGVRGPDGGADGCTASSHEEAAVDV